MRNRLILAAYPKGPRRAEIEDVLLQSAADGRGGVGVRGAIDLLWHGLRARLGRPGSDGVVVLAALVALVAGFLLASAGNRLAWEAVPDLPAGTARAALGELVAPGSPVDWSADASAGNPYPVVDGKVGARRIRGAVAGTPRTADAAGYLSGLEPRLVGEGWRILDSPSTGPTDGTRSTILLARDADFVLRIEDVHDVTNRQSRLNIEVHRAEPPWVSVLTVAAGALGALLGWLLFGWASRRVEHRPVAMVAAFVPAVLGLLMLAPALAVAPIFLNVLSGGYVSGVPFWAGLVPAGEFGMLPIPAGVLLGGAVLITACARPGRGLRRAAA